MSIDNHNKSVLREARRSAIWRSARVRSIVIQISVALAVLALLVIAGLNAAGNLQDQGKTSGFGFLNEVAGYDIAFSIIPYDRETDTHGRVLLVGIANTLLVSVFGIVLSTILGTVIGIMRLSGNWLVARLASVYIEIIRNVPLLIQILFWYSVVLMLPVVRQSIDIGGLIFINNRGMALPKPILEEGFALELLALGVAVAGCVAVWRWSVLRRRRSGRGLPVFWLNLALLVLLPSSVWFALGSPVTWEIPERGPFEFSGGIAILPSFVAMLIALTAYTAAFIGEIVRAGILSVGKGQTEASQALGLSDGQTMSLVVLPQALRVIVPPTTSQYLNLTKNSSLGIVVGYPDIVSTFGGSTLTQTGQEIETLFLVMMFYLSVSLIIALIMNLYNRAVALKGA